MYNLYDDNYEYFYTAQDTNTATKLIVKLKVLSPVLDSFQMQWLEPYTYYVIYIIEDRFDQGFSVSDQNVLRSLLGQICRTYCIPTNRIITIIEYENVLEGMSRFPRLIQYVDFNILSSDEQMTYNELYLDERNYILTGQQIKYNINMSVGFEKIYEKYKKYI